LAGILRRLGGGSVEGPARLVVDSYRSLVQIYGAYRTAASRGRCRKRRVPALALLDVSADTLNWRKFCAESRLKSIVICMLPFPQEPRFDC
jgi:hypothetical protein